MWRGGGPFDVAFDTLEGQAGVSVEEPRSSRVELDFRRIDEEFHLIFNCSVVGTRSIAVMRVPLHLQSGLYGRRLELR